MLFKSFVLESTYRLNGFRSKGVNPKRIMNARAKKFYNIGLRRSLLRADPPVKVDKTCRKAFQQSQFQQFHEKLFR